MGTLTDCTHLHGLSAPSSLAGPWQFGPEGPTLDGGSNLCAHCTLDSVFSACTERIPPSLPPQIHHLSSFVTAAKAKRVVKSQCDGSQPRGLFEAAAAVLQLLVSLGRVAVSGETKSVGVTGDRHTCPGFWLVSGCPLSAAIHSAL